MMHQSYEENDVIDLDLTTSITTEEIFSTSLKEKSIIFSKIENEVDKNIDILEDQQRKYKLAVEEMKLRYIERYYTKKFFAIVMKQLIKDREQRFNHKLWKSLINSI